MTPITAARLSSLLSDCRGATPVTFIAETTPKMNKTGNPFYGRITKVARVNGMVNFRYDEGVLRRLEKEGKTADSFDKGESWHTAVVREDGTITPFAMHKKTGKIYLRFMLVGTIESVYRDEHGKDIDKSVLEPWLQKSDYANQGLENPLIFLTYGLDSIRAITFNNQGYIVV